MFKEKHDAMIKRVDESNNYSDLRKPWCSFRKIHGDMEQENEAASTNSPPQTPLHPERKMSKIVTTRSIFKTKKQELQEASLTPTLTLTLTPTPTATLTLTLTLTKQEMKEAELNSGPERRISSSSV